MISMGADDNGIRPCTRDHPHHVRQQAVLYRGLPMEGCISVGLMGACCGRFVQLLLEGTKAVSGGVLAISGEETLREVRADPCTGECLVGRELPVKSAGPSCDTASSFIRTENRSCRSKIAKGSSISGEADLVGVTDGALVVVRLATEEEYDAIVYVDSVVIVDPLGRIDDAIADENDLTFEVGRRGVKDGEVVLA